MTLAERVGQLKKAQEAIPAALAKAAQNATLQAVEKAAELTPPTGGDLAGTNARTGQMKQHWATDSQTVPRKRGREIVTTLANNMEYASYVNDGHRMDRHFVPGLYVNPGSGLLEYDPSKKTGIVVGTKTHYVEGIHMTDEAEKTYRQALEKQLKEVEEMLK